MSEVVLTTKKEASYLQVESRYPIRIDRYLVKWMKKCGKKKVSCEFIDIAPDGYTIIKQY